MGLIFLERLLFCDQFCFKVNRVFDSSLNENLGLISEFTFLLCTVVNITIVLQGNSIYKGVFLVSSGMKSSPFYLRILLCLLYRVLSVL